MPSSGMRRPETRHRDPLYTRWINMRRWVGLLSSQRPEWIEMYKGINICPDWLDFKVYRQWCVQAGWKPGLQVVRRDKDRDFCPENCFVTTLAQANHLRRCVKKLADGRRVREILGFQQIGKDRKRANRITRRLKEGYTLADALKPGRFLGGEETLARTCLWCQKPFQATRRNQRYCCAKCATAASWRRRHPRTGFQDAPPRYVVYYIRSSKKEKKSC